MINWNNLRDGLYVPHTIRPRSSTLYRNGQLGTAFDEQYNDGLLVLAMAVVRQWILDRKPVQEYPFVLPWIEYIKYAMPDVYISIDDLEACDE